MLHDGDGRRSTARHGSRLTLAPRTGDTLVPSHHEHVPLSVTPEVVPARCVLPSASAWRWPRRLLAQPAATGERTGRVYRDHSRIQRVVRHGRRARRHVPMGSPPEESGRDADEGPQVEVTVEPFWIGKTEVTWDEFDQFAFVGNKGVRAIDLPPDAADAVSRPHAALRRRGEGVRQGQAGPRIDVTARRDGVLPLAVAGDRQGVPAADRGRVGVRRPCRCDRRAAGRPRGRGMASRQLRLQAAHGRRPRPRTRSACTTCSATSPSGRSIVYAETATHVAAAHSGHAAGGAADRQALSAPDARRVVRGRPTSCATPTARRRTRTGASAIRRCRRASTGTPMPITSASASSARVEEQAEPQGVQERVIKESAE